MRLAEHIDHYTFLADLYLSGRNLTRDDVKTGRDAWNIAHKASITNHAYAIDRDVLDAHIQTALQRVFPNAVFRDKKRY